MGWVERRRRCSVRPESALPAPSSLPEHVPRRAFRRALRQRERWRHSRSLKRYRAEADKLTMAAPQLQSDAVATLGKATPGSRAAPEAPFGVLIFPGGTEIGLEMRRSLAELKEVDLAGAGSAHDQHGAFA